MWTITTLKGFGIAPCMREISMVSKFTLGLKHPVQVQGVGMFPMFYLVVGRGISAEELRLLNARRVPTVHAGVVPAKIRITGTRHGKRCSHVRLS